MLLLLVNVDIFVSTLLQGTVKTIDANGIDSSLHVHVPNNYELCNILLCLQ